MGILAWLLPVKSNGVRLPGLYRIVDAANRTIGFGYACPRCHIDARTAGKARFSFRCCAVDHVLNSTQLASVRRKKISAKRGLKYV
jgi:hypothetical protein